MASTVGGIQGSIGQQVTTGTNAYDSLDSSAFIKMLVTELQNQDPLEPMDNAQILQQVGQIRSISSNDKLAKMLESVQLQQNVTTANNLLGKVISGLTDDSKRITGSVDKVSIAEGDIKLHIGEKTVSMNNVSEIQPEGTEIVAPTDGTE
jgi:flagellar basal-body rod modification protein FlgD